MNDFNLDDIWRLCNPAYKKVSWRHTKPVTMRRLNYFVVSDKTELDISACGFYAWFKVTTPQFLLRFPHFRRLLEGQATGSLTHSPPEPLIGGQVSLLQIPRAARWRDNHFTSVSPNPPIGGHISLADFKITAG